jgi:hypothetical protein
VASASETSYLTVRQAAARLGMTAQGVRKAVRERRLLGETRLLPNGRREYVLDVQAVEAFHADRASSIDDRVDSLLVQVALAEGAVRDKEREVESLRRELEYMRRELEYMRRDLSRARQALATHLQAFGEYVGEEETQNKAVGEMA